jgi:peptidoglycan/LPS O-acetylase OafA/YrhL
VVTGSPAPASTPPHGFRRDIQGLRGVAVALVVLSHAGVRGVAGGFVGVDVFFVISGFLITGLLLSDAGRGRIRFAHFYARRALRILPAATLVILVTAFAAVHILNDTRSREVLTDSLWAGLFAANIKFSHDGTDYFNQVAVSPLQHYWSLAVEEQFYLLWPALLAVTVLLLRRAGKPLPRGAIAVVLVFVGAASFLYSRRLGGQDPDAAYFSTFGRGWELVVGALLAAALPMLERLKPPIGALLTWLGCAGIGYAAWRFTADTPFSGTAALLPVLAAAALLAGGAGSPTWGANRLLALAPLRYLGNISYSLYLWHWPVLILGAAYIGHAPTPIQNVLLVDAALLLSIASYFLVENPLRRPRPLWTRRPSVALLAWPLAAGLVLLLVTVVRPSNSPATTIAGAAPSASTAAASTVAGTTAVVPAVAPGAGEVRASVLAAERGAKIPSDLDPTVGSILQDVTTIGDCSGFDRTENDICQYGDGDGSKKLVLFGNSHAVAWLPALGPTAKTAGWQLFPVVKESCDWGEYLGSDRYPQCGVWYRWALAKIKAMHPDVIVLNGYLGGPDWQPALAQAISDLKPLAGRVVLFTDPPGVVTPPVDCLQRRNATLQSCVSPLTDYSGSSSRTQRTMAAQAGIGFVDVQPWFCWKAMCPSVIGSRVVYTDVGHVTQTYAAHLTPLLAPALKLN